MHKSQLLNVFLGLNGTEKRALNKFVASPFFNQRQEVTDLWRYLVDHVGDGLPAYHKELIFTSIFPGEVYNDKKMRHVCSWLLKCIEEYLSYAAYKRTPVNETLHLAQVYKDKKQEKYFRKTLRTGQQGLANMSRGPEAFHLNYQLEFEKYSFVESRKRINENNLRQMTTALDKYLLMSKLKQACIMVSHRSVFTTEYNYKLVELLLDFLTESPYLKEPGIACYYYCYKALSEDNEICFQDLQNVLQEHQTIIPSDDVEYLYYSSINFCIRKMNTGVERYRREAFELYRSGLENKILLKAGELSRFAYNNIISIGLTLTEFDWLENFIYEYKSMIDSRFRESYFTYNLAKLNFSRKDYDKAMQLLIQVDGRDLLLNLDAKAMLIRIYFERKEYDALTSLLSSFSVMLNRKKVLSYHKKHYQNIIHFTNRILNLKPSDQKSFDKLRLDIEQAEVLGLKDWLLEQLEKNTNKKR